MFMQIDGRTQFIGTGGVDWQESGNGLSASTPLLVLVHGAGMDHSVWLLLSRYFSRRGYRLVVPDLPGHGRSDGPLLDSIDAMATHLWQLLDQLIAADGLAPERIILGGHSMGALVALQAAAQRADKTHQLLLFGVSYPMPVGEPLLKAAANNEVAAIDMITLFGHAYHSLLGHNPLSGISVMNSARVLMGKAADGVIHNDLAACNDYQGGEAAAAAWQGPTTIIAGDSDRMTAMRGTRALAERLPTARIALVEKSGHMMMQEQPEATLSAVKQALEQSM